jgi:hypothetical protein
MAAKNVTAPRLPTAPAEYSAQYIDMLLSILRQYFNGLDNPGPIVAATQVTVRDGVTNIVAALSCSQQSPNGSQVVLSIPTDADFASLRAGDIYCDTSGGAAPSYPLRIKA